MEQSHEEEYYVIVSKSDIKKYPIDKRNRFIKKGDTTMDIVETYFYIKQEDAQDDIEPLGFNTKDYETKKVVFNYKLQ
jgi:hypothetical protein